MYFSRIWKIKEGKLEKFKAWMQELSTTRKEEAIATFEFEHVTREVFVLFKGNDSHDYVIGLNEATTEPLPGAPSVAINQEHSSIKKECLEPITEQGQVLLDLEV